jgi:hypothetical protein
MATGSQRLSVLTCLAAAALTSGLLGCAGKKLPPLIFPKTLYPAESYAMHTAGGGAVVAVVPYAPGQSLYLDPRQPTPPPENVPLNIVEAGVLPVRIILTNRGDGELVVEPSQFFCLSGDTPYKSYPPQRAMALVIGSEAFKQALKGTSVGPLLKSIFGGELLFSAATSSVGGVVRGGLIGGASGAASSATGTALARANQYENALTRLLNDQADADALKSQVLMPGFTTDGILYCPSTVDVRAIRLTLYDRTNERPLSLLSPLTPSSISSGPGAPSDDD